MNGLERENDEKRQPELVLTDNERVGDEERGKPRKKFKN